MLISYVCVYVYIDIIAYFVQKMVKGLYHYIYIYHTAFHSASLEISGIKKTIPKDRKTGKTVTRGSVDPEMTHHQGCQLPNP